MKKYIDDSMYNVRAEISGLRHEVRLGFETQQEGIDEVMMTAAEKMV
jgi:hypothetical protein